MYKFENKNMEFMINRYIENIQERNINGINDDLLEYIDEIFNEKIPLKMPDLNKDFTTCDMNRDMSQFLFKNICQGFGLYASVSQEICKNMADYIKDRKVLEVMAGRGWLAKGLREQGVDIISSDDFSWMKAGQIGLGTVTDVLDVSGLDAIKEYKKDSSLLLMAWPYMDNDGYQIVKSWGFNQSLKFQDKPRHSVFIV
jgi:hypothetical protein